MQVRVSAGPRQSVPTVRSTWPGPLVRRVRLLPRGRLGFRARTMLARELRDWVAQALILGNRTDHQDRAPTVARTDEDLLDVRWAMHEVPYLQPPLLTLDE